MKKYEFTGVEKNGLKQIIAIRNFGFVRNGSIGGWIEKEENLSHKGDCWISGDARVSGHAQVSENAQVLWNARVSGYAKISGYARVYGNAHVFGNARVYENSQVCEDARICENARVSGYAHISGDAHIFGDSHVYGDTQVYGNSKIQLQQHVQFGHVKKDLLEDLSLNIVSQTGLIPEEDHIICYKRVNEDLSSEYDPNFVYKVGEWNEAVSWKEGHDSCSAGLHVSNGIYYPKVDGSVILKCKVMLEDIITVQEGKIRCKKLFVEKIAY